MGSQVNANTHLGIFNVIPIMNSEIPPAIAVTRNSHENSFYLKKTLTAHYRPQKISESLSPITFLSDRRLSCGLSGALKSDGRRRKEEPAGILTAKKNPVVTAFISQPSRIRPCGPGGGGWTVGATGVQIRRGSGLRGARGFRYCSVPDVKLNIYVCCN